MQHARKMVLVPAESYNNENSSSQFNQKNNTSNPISHSELNKDLSEHPTIQTRGNNLTRLDEEMYNIIFSKKFANDYEKSKNYLQVLQRYLHFKEKERIDMQHNIDSNDIINENFENIQISNQPLLANNSNENDFTINLNGKTFTNENNEILKEKSHTIDKNVSSNSNLNVTLHEKSIIDSIPISYQKKASALLQFWNKTNSLAGIKME